MPHRRTPSGAPGRLAARASLALIFALVLALFGESEPWPTADAAPAFPAYPNVYSYQTLTPTEDGAIEYGVHMDKLGKRSARFTRSQGLSVDKLCFWGASPAINYVLSSDGGSGRCIRRDADVAWEPDGPLPPPASRPECSAPAWGGAFYDAGVAPRDCSLLSDYFSTAWSHEPAYDLWNVTCSRSLGDEVVTTVYSVTWWQQPREPRRVDIAVSVKRPGFAATSKRMFTLYTCYRPDAGLQSRGFDIPAECVDAVPFD